MCRGTLAGGPRGYAEVRRGKHENVPVYVRASRVTRAFQEVSRGRTNASDSWRRCRMDRWRIYLRSRGDSRRKAGPIAGGNESSPSVDGEEPDRRFRVLAVEPRADLLLRQRGR